MQAAMSLGHDSYLRRAALNTIPPVLLADAFRMALEFDIQEERQTMSLDRMKAFSESCRRELKRVKDDMSRHYTRSR